MTRAETPGAAGPDFVRLGDLLGEVGALRSPGSGRTSAADTGRRLAALWADAVGPEISANAEPLHMRQGRLVVAASSSAWAQTLQLMAGEIKARLNVLLQNEEVEEITFRHAGWEDRSRGGQPEASTQAHGEQLSEEQRAALGEVEGLDLDPNLREKITQAMQASFGRGEQDSGR
jgi:predicted nucleic acid-binding Zn ribbon protein